MERNIPRLKKKTAEAQEIEIKEKISENNEIVVKPLKSYDGFEVMEYLRNLKYNDNDVKDELMALYKLSFEGYNYNEIMHANDSKIRKILEESHRNSAFLDYRKKLNELKSKFQGVTDWDVDKQIRKFMDMGYTCRELLKMETGNFASLVGDDYFMAVHSPSPKLETKSVPAVETKSAPSVKTTEDSIMGTFDVAASVLSGASIYSETFNSNIFEDNNEDDDEYEYESEYHDRAYGEARTLAEQLENDNCSLQDVLDHYNASDVDEMRLYMPSAEEDLFDFDKLESMEEEEEEEEESNSYYREVGTTSDPYDVAPEDRNAFWDDQEMEDEMIMGYGLYGDGLFGDDD